MTADTPAARSWTTSEVARLSGVTSRTLRHYDAVGLLRPLRTDTTGLRHYGEDELVRLQQILVLRELGLPLDRIAAALDGDGGCGPVTAELLARHRDRLVAERTRLTRLTTTIERTIDHLRGGTAMDPAELFEGFDADRQAAYEEELVDRYGERARERIEESHRRIGAMSSDDALAVQEVFAEVDRRLAELIDAGAQPGDDAVQEVLVEHHAAVARFWTPDRVSYAGLGELYVDSPDFRARYDAVHPRLAEFLRDAMAVYAQRRLD